MSIFLEDSSIGQFWDSWRSFNVKVFEYSKIIIGKIHNVEKTKNVKRKSGIHPNNCKFLN